ncbi:MAG: ATP-dependent sacrificial sulfur transferase LarE [Bacteroidales bacterium]|nr:ATP-dependent sacrificial sulfur transferase LarE [Bacteroidales bacterium]MBN2819158.1 ATP-dependent sacrificial sulfur transferase LarE [Bacteroidales bacterium]
MNEKENRIRDWFEKNPKVLVALSGGVDSCLVAFLGRKYLGKENAVSVVGVSPSLKTKDYELTLDFCTTHDIQLVEVNPDEINDPNYASNPINRCYFCKTNLYDVMHQLRKDKYPEYILVNGNNQTDWGDYRPGLKAAEENKAYSPLADCGFEKEDIRELAKEYNLSVWDKPASPCLSSRFPYGESITADKLKMVEKAEDLLNNYGFTDVRVRYYNTKARIEVPEQEVEKLDSLFTEIAPKIVKFGFTDCEIDAEGLVSGKLNRVLGK